MSCVTRRRSDVPEVPTRVPIAEGFRDRVLEVPGFESISASADLLVAVCPEVLARNPAAEKSRDRMLPLPEFESISTSADLPASVWPEVLRRSLVVESCDRGGRNEARLPTRESASVTGNLEDTRLVVL